MNYQLQYKILAHGFSQHSPTILINDLSTQIENYRFKSNFPLFRIKDKQAAGESNGELTLQKLRENDNFTYSVFLPSSSTSYNKAILLLHGLNERSWEKYLVWAQYMSKETGQPVILFPLAFHMNRSPVTWNNPREMSKIADYRKKNIPGLRDSSYLNAALSVRIGNNPEQFFLSGIQSYLDVIRFSNLLKSGAHPNFQKNTQINICSYSIGTFLSQLLVMDNPLGLFDSTRLFLFCGGATFDQMNGISRFILDSEAFLRLRSFANEISPDRLKDYFNRLAIPELKNIWKPLYYMTFLKEGRKQREDRLNKIGSQIYAIGLDKDKVIPPHAIISTLKGQRGNLPPKVEILDFPYEYTHENPFPIKNELIQNEVSLQFKLIFDKVSEFLR
jgi:hypothetical protein